MLTKTTIRLPRNIPAKWLTRFKPPMRGDTPLAFHRVWETWDGAYCVAGYQCRYGGDPLRWFSFERGRSRPWNPIGSERERRYGHRTARPAFEAVVRAMGGGAKTGRS